MKNKTLYLYSSDLWWDRSIKQIQNWLWYKFVQDECPKILVHSPWRTLGFNVCLERLHSTGGSERLYVVFEIRPRRIAVNEDEEGRKY